MGGLWLSSQVSDCNEKTFSAMSNLRVSIITVCYNSARSIEATIKSVLIQTYSNIEYLVIDGKSTDGTPEILERYKDRISVLISEKDKGHIDAMNKGIGLATGDIVYILNSDDILYDKDVVRDVVVEFEKQPSPDFVHGKVLLVDLPHGNLVFDVNRNFRDKNYFLKYEICHQSLFCKKTLFNKAGLLDIRYKICADFNWLLYASALPGVKFRFIDRLVAIYSCKGMANQAKNKFTYIWEKIIIVNKHFSLLLFIRFLINFLIKILGIS